MREGDLGQFGKSSVMVSDPAWGWPRRTWSNLKVRLRYGYCSFFSQLGYLRYAACSWLRVMMVIRATGICSWVRWKKAIRQRNTYHSFVTWVAESLGSLAFPRATRKHRLTSHDGSGDDGEWCYHDEECDRCYYCRAARQPNLARAREFKWYGALQDLCGM